MKNRAAIVAAIERWISADSARARVAREEAARIGISHIPKRYEQEQPGPEITPISDGPPIYQFFELSKFMFVLIAQLIIVLALSALGRRLFGSA